jgi:hypothetical protein
LTAADNLLGAVHSRYISPRGKIIDSEHDEASLDL